MLRTVAILALLGLAAAATITKKDGYGGASYQQGASYGGSSGGSYDASSYTNTDSSYGVGTSGASSYGGSSTYGSSSYGSEGSNSGDSYGNLYYYYYPVTNHSSQSSYGHGGGGSSGSYGGGGGASYGGGNSYGSNAVGSYGSGGGGGGSYGGSGGSYGGSGGSYGSGGGGGNYAYSGPPPPYGSDPMTGLLSIIDAIDINSLILPVLLIGGIALLLPALLNCNLQLGTCVIPLPNLGPLGGVVRRRRDVGYTMEEITITQMIDHAYRIYEAVQEGEQCMQRVVCELGGMMRNLKGKEVFFSVLDHFASESYKKQLDVLKRGALPTLPSKGKEWTCEAYSCGKIDNSVE